MSFLERDLTDTSPDAEGRSSDLSVVPGLDGRADGDLGRGEGSPSRGVDSSAASRPGSEAYLTASDDSSSLFDEDMQRAERPTLILPHRLHPGNDDAGDDDDDDDDDEDDDDEPADPNGNGASCPDDLSRRFQSQRLDSSKGDAATAIAASSPTLTPALTPKRPTPNRDPGGDPASPKQPRLRTPTSPGSSAIGPGLAKRHLSQPMPPPPLLMLGTGTGHGGHAHAHGHTHSRNAISMLRPPRPQETDLDQEQEEMETGGEEEEEEEQEVEKGKEEEEKGEIEEREKKVALLQPPERPKPEAPPSPPNSVPANKPPTPPLHRLPSWVSRGGKLSWSNSSSVVVSLFYGCLSTFSMAYIPVPHVI